MTHPLLSGKHSRLCSIIVSPFVDSLKLKFLPDLQSRWLLFLCSRILCSSCCSSVGHHPFRSSRLFRSKCFCQLLRRNNLTHVVVYVMMRRKPEVRWEIIFFPPTKRIHCLSMMKGITEDQASPLDTLAFYAEASSTQTRFSTSHPVAL